MFFYEWERSKSKEYLYHQFSIDLTFPTHLHHSFELVCVKEGEMILTVGDESYTVCAGEIAVIPPDTLHSYKTEKFSNSYLCVFSIDYCYDLYKYLLSRKAVCPVFKLDDDGIIAELCGVGDNLYFIKSILYSIAGQFLTKCEFTEKKKSEKELIETVVGWLQEHFTEPVDMKALSEYTGYHYNYLSSWFHKNLGASFSDIINQYRIDLAVDLLINTDMTITEISGECGFETVRTFNRNFLEIKGETPGEVRKSAIK